jgi:hypothetical protein
LAEEADLALFEVLAVLFSELRLRAQCLPTEAQAQAIIMDHWLCDADTAARLLRRASRSLARSEHDLAVEVVAAVLMGEPVPCWLDSIRPVA